MLIDLSASFFSCFEDYVAEVHAPGSPFAELYGADAVVKIAERDFA